MARHYAAVQGTRSHGGREARREALRGRPGSRSQDASPASHLEPARQAAPVDFDRLIHERIRLGIVSALAISETMTFSDLKKILRTTDGNLSVHARKLEEARYIDCTKSFEGRLPKTEYRLTPAGRRALERYLGHMEALIRATRER